MALTDSDLEGMTLETQRKSEPGKVAITQLPPALVALMVQETPRALADTNYELVLRVPIRHTPAEIPAKETETDKAKREQTDKEAHRAATEKAIATSKQLSAYATAWGKGQDPKLYITKNPPTKEEKGKPIARLKVQLDSEVQKKRGRQN